jgi:hypothetical protein
MALKEEVFGLAFVAAMETAAVGEPRHSPFDTHRWRPSRCEVSMPRWAIRGMMPRERSHRRRVGVVVALVAVELVGPSTAGNRAAADRWCRHDKRLQRKTVMNVRRGEYGRPRRAGRMGR